MCARAIRDGAQAQLMRGDIRLQLGFLFVSGKTLPQRVYDNDADATCNVCGYERAVVPTVKTYTITFVTNGGSPVAQMR